MAVMEMGSFAKAATRLGTSAGQASKSVTRLEEELGVRLLNRTTRALAATEVGQAYFESMRHLLDELDALDQSIKSRSGMVSGKLKLTAPTSFGAAQLTPVLIDFALRFPDVELNVNFSDRVVNLVDEGFDAGVRIGNLSDSSLIARKLCDARIVLAASSEYLKERGVPLNPDDLSKHNCIVDTNFRDPLTWRFRDPSKSNQVVVSVDGRLRFSSADACLAAAERGLGILKIPSFMAGPLFRAKRLVPLLKNYEDTPSGVYAIYPSGRHLAFKVRALIDFLEERFHREPEWDQDW